MNTLQFLDIPLENISKLLELLNPSNISFDDSKTDFLINQERILYQRDLKHPFPPQKLSPHIYKLQKISEITLALELLCLFDHSESKDTKLNARKYICKFLTTKYQLPDTSNNMPSSTDFHKNTGLDTSYLVNAESEILSGCDSPNIRKEIRSFLEMMNRSNYVHMSYSTSNTKDSKSNDKTRYSIPQNEIHDLLLFFRFYDGRRFNNKNTNNLKRLPKRNPNPSPAYTYQSYLNTLEQIQNTFITMPPSESNLVQLYRFDKLFSYRKLNLLKEYYDIYASEDMISDISFAFKQKYSDIYTTLKKWLTSDDFLSLFMRSKLLDPFLPFHTSFCSTLLSDYSLRNYNSEHGETTNPLSAFIDDCARAYINANTDISFISLVAHIPKHTLSFWELINPNSKTTFSEPFSEVKETLLQDLIPSDLSQTPLHPIVESYFHLDINSFKSKIKPDELNTPLATEKDMLEFIRKLVPFPSFPTIHT